MSDALHVLSEKIGERLLARHWKLATAESCTGGLVSSAVTDIAGASGWFDRGYVTYSNTAKMEELGVGKETLDAHGAVSEETARAMAAGALRASHVQITVAITGIAGPDGGTPEKPVGTVCFAWAMGGGKVDSETRHFTGNRAEVRQQSAAHALKGLVKRLNDPD